MHRTRKNRIVKSSRVNSPFVFPTMMHRSALPTKRMSICFRVALVRSRAEIHLNSRC